MVRNGVRGLLMTEQELKIISHYFGVICDYSPMDDEMSEFCNEWCAENCGSVEGWECWQKWLELKKGEKE